MEIKQPAAKSTTDWFCCKNYLATKIGVLVALIILPFIGFIFGKNYVVPASSETPILNKPVSENTMVQPSVPASMETYYDIPMEVISSITNGVISTTTWLANIDKSQQEFESDVLNFIHYDATKHWRMFFTPSYGGPDFLTASDIETPYVYHDGNVYYLMSDYGGTIQPQEWASSTEVLLLSRPQNFAISDSDHQLAYGDGKAFFYGMELDIPANFTPIAPGYFKTDSTIMTTIFRDKGRVGYGIQTLFTGVDGQHLQGVPELASRKLYRITDKDWLRHVEDKNFLYCLDAGKKIPQPVHIGLGKTQDPENQKWHEFDRPIWIDASSTEAAEGRAEGRTLIFTSPQGTVYNEGCEEINL